MFSTKTAVVNNEEFSGGKYMPVGINDNITLKEVNVKTSPQGNDFLEVAFQNEQGQEAKFTEWKNTKNQWITTDEDLQKRDNAQFGRLCQLLDCYYPERPEAELSTFKEMIDWVKSKLDPMIPLKKGLRIKVVYDKKGFQTVSKLGLYVEPMTVSADSSQIKLFKNDLLERPVQADVEVNDPLNTPPSVTPDAASVNGVSDLPF
jgi:hypothetical protein